MAPGMNPGASIITGVACGIRAEDIEDRLLQNIRRPDKLIDEPAKGRPMEKNLRRQGRFSWHKPMTNHKS